MLNGFWAVRFQTSVDAGAGVVTIQDGRATGGDSSFSYVGPLSVEQDGKVAGKLSIMRHSDLQRSLIPGVDNYVLSVSGTFDGSTFRLSGTAEERPNASVTIEGRRLSIDHL